jgi:hypothetical protein
VSDTIVAKGAYEMANTTTRMRSGWRAFGRALLLPLTDMERTIACTAHLQRQLIRTDALPEAARERRAHR